MIVALCWTEIIGVLQVSTLRSFNCWRIVLNDRRHSWRAMYSWSRLNAGWGSVSQMCHQQFGPDNSLLATLKGQAIQSCSKARLEEIGKSRRVAVLTLVVVVRLKWRRVYDTHASIAENGCTFHHFALHLHLKWPGSSTLQASASITLSR